MTNEAIAFEVGDGRGDLHLASISLSLQAETDHWNGEELGVRPDVSWHGHSASLDVGCCKVLESFWWVSDSVDRNFFHDEVCEFIIRLGVIRTEINIESYRLTTIELSLAGLNSIVSDFFLEGDLLDVLGFED